MILVFRVSFIFYVSWDTSCALTCLLSFSLLLYVRTINVEYNQLDPLLRASGSDGDVNDSSGFSPYPGNINQLLFRLEDYVSGKLLRIH